MAGPFRYTPQSEDNLIEMAVRHLLEGEAIEGLTEFSLTKEHSEEQFGTTAAGDAWLVVIQQDENLPRLEEFLTVRVAELYQADTIDLDSWDCANQHDQYEDAKMLAQEEARDMQRYCY